MRHGVNGQGPLEVSVSGWDNDIYHVRIVEVETVVVLTKVTVCDIHFIIKPIEEVCGYLRIPVKLNSDSGICEHHFRKVCGQGFFEQKLSFEGRHLFDSLNKPAAKRSAAVVDPRRWNRTVHLTSEYVH